MRRIPSMVLAALLAMTLPAAAQITAEGSIRGTVKDEQGGVLPGVAVSAKSPQAPTPVTTITDARRQLPPAEHAARRVRPRPRSSKGSRASSRPAS